MAGNNAYLPPANKVWGKVIFSEACVKNSVNGGCLVWGRLVPGGGACSRGVWSGGSGPRGCLLWGSGPGGVTCSWGGAWCRHPQMVTAAGSTHPTGMHFCIFYIRTEYWTPILKLSRTLQSIFSG